nr:ethylbenzene dehydrogenase-related protein [Psychromonas aquimarina]
MGRLNRKGEGSAGTNQEAASLWKDGKYTVIFKRKLDTGFPEDDKRIKIGGTYDFNIAIHDGQATTRYHYVTLTFTLGIGDNAQGSVVSTQQ